MRTPQTRKAPWHARVIRKSGDWMERVTRGRVVHVMSSAAGKGRKLSNFTPAPFQLDGVTYASFEAFWQSLKFKPRSRARELIRTMNAGDAKRAGGQIQTRVMFYGNKLFEYGSDELFALAKRAERARFNQNPEQKKALMETGNAKLIHWAEVRDSKSLPRKVFCRILMELREEFKQEK